MSKFTPGPWLIDDDGQWFSICGGNHCVAQVHAPTSASLDLAEANARLIAAAPEMYEVARRVADHFADTDAPLGIAARAALAKVEES